LIWGAGIDRNRHQADSGEGYKLYLAHNAERHNWNVGETSDDELMTQPPLRFARFTSPQVCNAKVASKMNQLNPHDKIRY
jgi:hypothetical protein